MGLLGIALFFVSMQAFAQSADWEVVFRNLASRDLKVSEGARNLAFQKLIPALEAAPPSPALDKDIAAIAGMFGSKDQETRLQASGLLFGLSMRRADGETALRSAIPVLLSQFEDSNPRVRGNAIASIANLRPGIPKAAVPALIRVARSSDKRASDGALYGLARLSHSAPEAANEVLSALSSDSNPDRQRVALRSIGHAQTSHPDVILGIAPILRSQDASLAREAVTTVTMLGARADALRPELDRLARSMSDRELAALAAAAIKALDRR